jgi:hypothetical protein
MAGRIRFDERRSAPRRETSKALALFVLEIAL